MNTLRTRTLPLLASVAVCAALSWGAIYASWFAIWTFHSVPAMRVCEAAATLFLTPARCIFEWLGGDQTTQFFEPVPYSGTNGLVLGIILYSLLRGYWRLRGKKPQPINRANGHPTAKSAPVEVEKGGA